MKLWKLAIAATAVSALGMSASCQKPENQPATAATVVADQNRAAPADATITPLQALGPRFTMTPVAKGGEVNVLLLHDERGCDYLVTSSIYEGNSMAMTPLMEINANSSTMPQRQVCAGR